MSADLAIYALPNTPRTRVLLDEYNGHDFIGDPMPGSGLVGITHERWDELTAELFGWGNPWTREAQLPPPRVWVGQVSWMKAGLLGGSGAVRKWVPQCVAEISRLLDGNPVITPGLAKAVTVAMNLPHTSWYERIEWIYSEPYAIGGGWGRRARYYPTEYQSKITNRLVGPHRIQRIKSRGVARPREIKRFMQANVGRIAVPISE